MTRIFLMISIFLAAAGIVFLSSCTEENPDLVSPPPPTESVGVRFINFAGDKQDRVLHLSSEVFTLPVTFGACSETVRPPSDSSYPYVTLDGQQEFKASRKIRFIRNTYYTVFGLPSDPLDSVQRVMDTLIALYSTVGLSPKADVSYVKMFNAIPDLDLSFKLTAGCQNGEILASNIKYRGQSPQFEVRSGKMSVSLTATKGGTDSLIGMFNLELNEFAVNDGQYILLISGSSDNPKLSLINEYMDEEQPLTTLEPEVEQNAYFRAVNFSRQAVDVKKNEIDNIAENLSTDQIDVYVPLKACGSLVPDVIGAYINDEVSGTVSTSLAVEEKYTVLVFDSAETSAGRTVLTEPIFLSAQTGRSVIRVVNGNYSTGNITLSLGTRYYDSLESGSWNNDSLKYKSGQVLASNLAFGGISEAMYVPSGLAPITLFTSTQPANLIFAGIETLESEKNYLLVVNQDTESDEIRLSLVDEDEEGLPVRHIPEGEFTQIVNMIPDTDKLSISIPPLIPSDINAKFYYTSVVATVLPIGANSINVSGQTININAEVGKRELLIVTGTADNIEFIEFNEYPEENSLYYYKRRFINACKEQDFISIKINKDDEDFPYYEEMIPFGESSIFRKEELERKLSYFFIKQETGETIHRIGDISLPFGKNYSVIFGGKSIESADEAITGYSVVILQEY